MVKAIWNWNHVCFSERMRGKLKSFGLGLTSLFSDLLSLPALQRMGTPQYVVERTQTIYVTADIQDSKNISNSVIHISILVFMYASILLSTDETSTGICIMNDTNLYSPHYKSTTVFCVGIFACQDAYL